MKRRAFDCSMDQKREYQKNLIGCAVERKYPRRITRMKCINVLESLKVTLNANLREVAIVSPNWSIASFTWNTHFQTMSDRDVFQHVRKCMWWLLKPPCYWSGFGLPGSTPINSSQIGRERRSSAPENDPAFVLMPKFPKVQPWYRGRWNRRGGFWERPWHPPRPRWDRHRPDEPGSLFNQNTSGGLSRLCKNWTSLQSSEMR